MKILLNTLEKVKNFVNIISKYESEAILESENHMVDAKSILGIFSLNLTNPMNLTLQGTNIEENKKILKEIEIFLNN